jgi:cystathionine beta-lyase
MKETAKFVDRHGTASLKWDLLERIYGDKDMLSMWVADMDFRCPEAVHEAMLEQMKVGAYGYSALHTRFMNAFAKWEEERHGYHVENDWLRYAPGVVPAVNWCVATMTEPGDHVMTLPPVYYPFFSAVTANERKLVLSPLRREGERYEMDYADMEEKMVSEHVRMLIFCSPHNPVGRVWTREELEKLVKLCRKHHVTIVSDEIHQDFVFAPAKHIPLATLEPNAVTLTAPSKTFNLAGMQTAVVIIPQDTLREKWDAFTKRLHLNSGSTFGYLAGEAAYLHGAPWLEELKQIIYGNYLFLREKLLAALPELVIPPLEGTYLMWVDFGAYVKPEEQKEFFTKKCRIALDYGAWFKGDGETFARFNLATSRENVEKAAEAVITALK